MMNAVSMKPAEGELVGPGLEQVLREMERAAQSNASVLILGESGTGKTTVARAIHRSSPRRFGPFVAVACTTLTDNLAADELLGHERGAFTGADSSARGRIRSAHGGTLFLDEIGDATPTVQALLLDAIERKVITPVGPSSQPVDVDFRLIAATNQDLAQRMEEGRFRRDLYYRLHVLSIRMPALRERAGDIACIARHYLGPGWHLDPAALERLREGVWPGNVRELLNLLERARSRAESRTIDLRCLELDAAPVMRAVPSGRKDPEPRAATPELIEKLAVALETRPAEVERLLAIARRSTGIRFASTREVARWILRGLQAAEEVAMLVDFLERVDRLPEAARLRLAEAIDKDFARRGRRGGWDEAFERARARTKPTAPPQPQPQPQRGGDRRRLSFFFSAALILICMTAWLAARGGP